MAMILETMRAVGICPNSLLEDKTKEILRLLDQKIPIGSLKKSESCRILVAIELSCRLTKTVFDSNKIINFCCISSKDYQNLLNICKSALNLEWSSTSVQEVLTIRYSAGLVNASSELLKTFDERFIQKLPENSRCFVKLNSPLNQCAAFYLAASKNKVKIDKVALCKLAEVSMLQLKKTVDHMQSILSNQAPAVNTLASSNNNNVSSKPLQYASMLSTCAFNNRLNTHTVVSNTTASRTAASHVNLNHNPNCNEKHENIMTKKADKEYFVNNCIQGDSIATNVMKSNPLASNMSAKRKLVTDVDVVDNELVNEMPLNECNAKVTDVGNKTERTCNVLSNITSTTTREAYIAWRDEQLSIKRNKMAKKECEITVGL